MLLQAIQGNTYDNPIGLAAGFKICEVPKALEHLGFGALELANHTWTLPGNPVR